MDYSGASVPGATSLQRLMGAERKDKKSVMTVVRDGRLLGLEVAPIELGL